MVQCKTLLITIMIGCALSLHAHATQQVQVQVHVTDHYTGRPLASARIELLHGNDLLDTGFSDASGKVVVSYAVTGIWSDAVKEKGFRVENNHPNPFESETTINFYHDQTQQVYAEMFSQLGRRVVSANAVLPQGHHRLRVVVPHAAPGMYFLTIRTGTHEPKAITLLKTGKAHGSNTGDIFFEQGNDYSHKTSEPQALKSQDAMPPYYIRVQKEKYGIKEYSIEAGKDTTLLAPLQRQNEVVIKTFDENKEVVTAQVMVTGRFFNLQVTTPDTLIIPSGKYTIRSDKGFFVPFEESVEIVSRDTIIGMGLEKLSARVVHIENPESDVLMAFETENGSMSYFYGIRDVSEKQEISDVFASEHSGPVPTHVVVRHPDQTTTTLIYNEHFYPIMWIDPSFVISLRRLGTDFAPERASHSIFHSNREDTLTVDIKPYDLYALVDWAEEIIGEPFRDARVFLSHYSDKFEDIQQSAMKDGADQPLYIRAAMAFSALSAIWAFEHAGDQQFPLAEKVIWAREILRNYIKNALADYFGLFSWDQTGPVVPVYLCQGGSKYYNICHFAFFTGPISPCIAICKATLDCFTNICMPEVMNVNQAIQVVRQY